MKRYLLFAGPGYYPLGGWDDFIGSFDSEAEAIKYALGDHLTQDWAHIADAEELTIVAEFSKCRRGYLRRLPKDG